MIGRKMSREACPTPPGRDDRRTHPNLVVTCGPVVVL